MEVIGAVAIAAIVLGVVFMVTGLTLFALPLRRVRGEHHR